MSNTLELLASANETLAAHSALLTRARTAQIVHRSALRALPSPPYSVLHLPLIPSPAASPAPSRSASPDASERRDKPELPPPKRARVLKYANYVAEEETVRNDYAQRYVDGGEWPQNWVLGAEPEKRFEELSAFRFVLSILCVREEWSEVNAIS